MKLFLFFISFISVLISNAQNLVPNPSFEIISECPLSLAEFGDLVENWNSFSITPDIFNVCNNDGLGTAGVPNNALGTQAPVSGSGYAGLILYASTQQNEREYIGCELTNPLLPGIEYTIYFHISHYDGGEFNDWRCASDKFGVKFINDPELVSPPAVSIFPDNQADFEFNEMFSDSSNWNLIQGSFTVDEEYNWIVFGNFYTDANTNTLELNNQGNCISAVYIDNICISVNADDCNSILSTNHFFLPEKLRVHPNPTSETINFDLGSKELWTVQIYDITGRVVLRKSQLSGSSTIEIKGLPSGTYFIYAESLKGRVVSNKFLKL
jgi:hypothetical protein